MSDIVKGRPNPNRRKTPINLDFKYMAQDACGTVVGFAEDPTDEHEYWSSEGAACNILGGRPNPDWRNTKINLETDGYEFEDGILRRIEKC